MEMIEEIRKFDSYAAQTIEAWEEVLKAWEDQDIFTEEENILMIEPSTCNCKE